MAITVATATVTDNPLRHRPGIMRADYHFEDSDGNVLDHKKVDSPVGTNVDDNLIPYGEAWQRRLKEEKIYAEEEAKSTLAVKKQAVVDEEKAIEDAVDAGMKAG